jgi:glycosyltransferase involved in cell wall biosynthesis
MTEHNRRALVVSTGFPEAKVPQQVGLEAYSYHFVARAFAPLLQRFGKVTYLTQAGLKTSTYQFVARTFAPLLQRWGKVTYLTQAESRLDFALHECRRQNLEPIHLSFQPIHQTYLSSNAPNVVFPFWEFPDIPDENFGDNPRNNWARLAACADLLLTASSFTRDAFLRARIQTPIHVVPVPIAPVYFDVPAWESGQRVVIDCPCYVLPQPEAPPPPPPNPWVAGWGRKLSLRERFYEVMKNYVRPRLPGFLGRGLTHVYRVLRAARRSYLDEERVALPAEARLELEGVVYTTLFNPFDPRKNWQDLLSAYLLALRDREDAMLVVKLAVNDRLMPCVVNMILKYYHELNIRHRCKVVLVPAYLSDSQMAELARGSTYYLNASLAEGACLPLQSFLAAGRPGVAPAHTALADYFTGDLGFVIASHPAPCAWPQDPSGRCRTFWHRPVWQSLHDRLRESYHAAREEARRYQGMAAWGRERMTELASVERVWPRLADALNRAWRRDEAVPRAA